MQSRRATALCSCRAHLWPLLLQDLVLALWLALRSLQPALQQVLTSTRQRPQHPAAAKRTCCRCCCSASRSHSSSRCAACSWDCSRSWPVWALCSSTRRAMIVSRLSSPSSLQQGIATFTLRGKLHAAVPAVAFNQASSAMSILKFWWRFTALLTALQLLQGRCGRLCASYGMPESSSLPCTGFVVFAGVGAGVLVDMQPGSRPAPHLDLHRAASATWARLTICCRGCSASSILPCSSSRDCCAWCSCALHV